MTPVYNCKLCGKEISVAAPSWEEGIIKLEQEHKWIFVNDNNGYCPNCVHAALDLAMAMKSLSQRFTT